MDLRDNVENMDGENEDPDDDDMDLPDEMEYSYEESMAKMSQSQMKQSSRAGDREPTHSRQTERSQNIMRNMPADLS